METFPELTSALDEFFSRGLITEVLSRVKSGKEATVYCCRGGAQAGGRLIAAKRYHPVESRRFKNDSRYQEGRVILDARVRRAVQKKTRFGMEAKAGMWVYAEYETLETLYALGANVPQPLALGGEVLLMEYFGNEEGPAPLLQQVHLDPDDAPTLFAVILQNIELWLAHNLVHGDLSPFNILFWDDAVTIIDFPQAVDPRFNPNALAMLGHDVEQVCRYFAKYGVAADPAAITLDLWQRFINAEL